MDRSGGCKPANELEPVVRRELQVPLLRTYWSSLTGDLAEGCIGNASVRVSIAGYVQSVEGIEPETEGLLPEGVEVLECRHVDVQVSRTARAAIVAVPKVLLAGTPKAQATPSALILRPRCVHGVADGSVPYQLLMLRCTIFSGRYWFARTWP